MKHRHKENINLYLQSHPLLVSGDFKIEKKRCKKGGTYIVLVSIFLNIRPRTRLQRNESQAAKNKKPSSLFFSSGNKMRNR